MSRPHSYDHEVYRVAGGWHAGSSELRIACFGTTPEEAKAKFEDAVQWRLALLERLEQEKGWRRL